MFYFRVEIFNFKIIELVIKAAICKYSKFYLFVETLFLQMILPILVIAPSEKGGNGVFTTTKIKANTIVEISPVIVMPKKDKKYLDDTFLYNYIFMWGEKKKQVALGLGYISMYNHSYQANCEYQMDYTNNTMIIKTVKDIKKGEELFINYNGSCNDTTPIWFEAL